MAFLKNGEPLQQRRIPLCWVRAMVQWASDFMAANTCPWPVSVIQGGQDTTVDGRYNLVKIKQQFPAASVHIVDSAMHHMVNEREDIREQIFQHLVF